MNRFLTTLSIGLFAVTPLALACPPESRELQPEDVPAAQPEARATPRPPALSRAQPFIRVSDDRQPKAAYVGVLMSPIPDALSAHVGSDGLMVVNIVKGSPADAAGLERFDILRKVNGAAINSMSDLAGAVERAGVGGKVELDLLRSGKSQTISITAAARQSGEPEYKYEVENDTVANPPTVRGHRLRVGPGGTVDLEDLGWLNDAGNLPPSVRDLLRSMQGSPFSNGYAWGLPGQNGWSGTTMSEFSATVIENGKKLSVHRGSDGRVDVERVDEQGNKTSTSYDNADQVQQKDPDAFKVLDENRAHTRTFSWRQPSGRQLPEARKQWQKAIEEHLKSIHAQRDAVNDQWTALEEQLRDLPAARHRMNQLRDRMQEATQELQRAREMLENAKSGAAADDDADDNAPSDDAAAKANSNADDDLAATIQADGRIIVSVREHGATKHYEFKNKQDFENREPKLFARFKALKD